MPGAPYQVGRHSNGERFTGASNGKNMTHANDAAPAIARTPAQKAYARQLLLMDIHITWGKLRREELASLAGRDELVALVVARYGIAAETAGREVDALLNGRSLGGDGVDPAPVAGDRPAADAA